MASNLCCRISFIILFGWATNDDQNSNGKSQAYENLKNNIGNRIQIGIALLLWITAQGGPLQVQAIQSSYGRSQHTRIFSRPGQYKPIHEKYGHQGYRHNPIVITAKINELLNDPVNIYTCDHHECAQEDAAWAATVIVFVVLKERIVHFVSDNEHQQALVNKIHCAQPLGHDEVSLHEIIGDP
jgi:hypothetical protein